MQTEKKILWLSFDIIDDIAIKDKLIHLNYLCHRSLKYNKTIYYDYEGCWKF